MARNSRISVIRRLLRTEGKKELLVRELPACARRVPETVRLRTLRGWKKAYALFSQNLLFNPHCFQQSFLRIE